VATISVTYTGLGPNDKPRLFQVKLHELFNKNRGVIDELRCRVAQVAQVNVFRVKLREFDSEEAQEIIKDSDGWKKVGCPHNMFASIDPVLTSLNDDLHLATAAASAEAITEVLELGQDPNIPDKSGNPVLFKACGAGHAHIVKLLLLGHADPEGRSMDFNLAPIHLAAQMGYVEVIKLLLAARADKDAVDAKEFGYPWASVLSACATLPHDAEGLFFGSGELITSFLVLGVAGDSTKSTPKGTTLAKAAQELVDRKAAGGLELLGWVSLRKHQSFEPSKIQRPEVKQSERDLHEAVRQNRQKKSLVGCIVMPSRRGQLGIFAQDAFAFAPNLTPCRLKIRNLGSTTAPKEPQFQAVAATAPVATGFLQEKARRLNKRREQLLTELETTLSKARAVKMKASAETFHTAQRKALGKLCLCQQSELGCSNYHGHAVDVAVTVRHSAIFYAAALGHEEVVKELTQAGCALGKAERDSNLHSQLAQEHGQRMVQSVLDLAQRAEALRAATREGQEKVVRCVLELAKAVTTENLHNACSSGQLGVVKCLVENRADINMPDENGRVPMCSAIMRGQLAIVDYLLETGNVRSHVSERTISPNQVSPQDLAPLFQTAVLSKNTKVSDRFLELRADVNSVDDTGKTPLHSVASMGTGYLLEARADLDAKDSEGQTPLAMVSKLGCDKMVPRLFLAAYKSDPNATSREVAAVQMACERRSPEMLECILRVGVDKAKSAEKELHALHIASANGLQQAVSCLLEARTEPDIRTKAGLTPLYFAAAWAREGVADCLLAAGAEIDAAASNGWTPLFVAVQRERVDIAKLLLKSRADMNRVDTKQRTPLYFAACMGQLRIARVMLRDRVLVNSRDRRGWTPLHAAIAHGQTDMVRSLIDWGADITITCTCGSTCAAFSALYNQAVAMELLLDKRADFNYAEQELYTPLHHAAEFGLLDGVGRLLEIRADVEKRTKEGCTALFLAAQEGRLKAVHLLVMARADINAQKISSSPRVRLESPELEGATPLFMAASTNHLDVVKYLIAAGADKDLRGPSTGADTPLCTAALQGHVQVLSTLLHSHAAIESSLGPETNVLLAAIDAPTKASLLTLLQAKVSPNLNAATAVSPFRVAIRSKNLEAMKWLVGAGVQQETADPRGWTPLHTAAHAGSVEAIRALLHMCVNIERTTNRGATPLLIAVMAGRKEPVAVLLKAQANVNHEKSEGWTPLLIAAASGRCKIAHFCLQARADVNCANSKGYAALHLAAAGGYPQVVMMLLQSRADKDAVGPAGTALTLAAARGFLKVIQVLLQAGASVDLPQEDGKTALYCAAARNQVHAVQLLLDAAADHEKPADGGFTPLRIAASRCYVETCRLMQRNVPKKPMKGNR
ncbi:Ank3, partial [Symbiodinium sp. CCMP2456]